MVDKWQREVGAQSSYKPKRNDFHKKLVCLFTTAVKSKNYLNVLNFPSTPRKIKYCLKLFIKQILLREEIFLPLGSIL